MGLKGKAITLVTIPRFDVALRDTTSPRLRQKNWASVKQIVKKEKERSSFAVQPKKMIGPNKNLAQNAF
jgi:hypothetical protein